MTTGKSNEEDYIKKQQAMLNRLAAKNLKLIRERKRLQVALAREQHLSNWLAHFFKGASAQKALPMLEQ